MGFRSRDLYELSNFPSDNFGFLSLVHSSRHLLSAYTLFFHLPSCCHFSVAWETCSAASPINAASSEKETLKFYTLLVSEISGWISLLAGSALHSRYFLFLKDSRELKTFIPNSRVFFHFFSLPLFRATRVKIRDGRRQW